ncbi:DUF262 domain-containing protein [Pseudomonas guguanensis]|uniref:DUF262 domain-containing protein n=1 Tax=Ectopseudomonas guguanensis TaxID=1198456 RepID=UPI003265907B
MTFNPNRQLIPKSLSVAELFKSTYFEVPYNQREYRWGKEQFEKLWDDLQVTIIEDLNLQNRRQLGHFLGAIVVIGEEQSHDQARWEIIDGQQRLTTISILSSCLMSYISLIKDNRTHRRLQHVLEDCIFSPNANYAPRIKLNREDDFYKNSLIKNEKREEKEDYWSHTYDKKSEVQKNIKSAFDFFYARIDEYINSSSEQEKEDKITNLVDILTMHFYVLVVRTENLWMAYRLFETLNERGLDLSQADLIKNMLLQHAKEDGTKALENVQGLWDAFIDNYEDQPSNKLDLPQLIQFSYSYRHGKVKKEKIFDEVSNQLRRGNTQAQGFASEFHKDSLNWRAFLLEELPNWHEIQSYQWAITGPLWKSHCAPFIFAAVDAYASETENLRLCLKLTENYLFRQGLIAKDSVSSLQEFFTEAASMLRSGVKLDSISELFQKRSSDELFKDNFKKASINNTKQGIYITSKIEELISNQETQDKQTLSLEYILPKKPSFAWGGIEKKEEFSSYVLRLGNLLPLPTHIAQNVKPLGLSDKIDNQSELDYKHSNSRLALELIDKLPEWTEDSEWTFRSIEARQAYMAENYALKAWSLI